MSTEVWTDSNTESVFERVYLIVVDFRLGNGK